MNRQPITVLIIIAFFFLLSEPLFRVFAEQDNGNQANTKTLAMAGLRDRVTVRRDERGIPYIEAKNQEDLYFAQGYVTASDRLWQMDLLRRTERGELAEVLGAGPNNAALEQDKQHRTLGFAQVVDAELARTPPGSRALMEAYAQGVNAYVGSLDAKALDTRGFFVNWQSFRGRTVVNLASRRDACSPGWPACRKARRTHARNFSNRCPG